MDILIVGSGGREYSIALALKKDKEVNKIYLAPGNGATSQIATNIEIKDYDKLADFVIQNKIDLTIVGPEAPLVDGIVDIFREKGLLIFGSSKSASRLEGSKVYMKNFLKKYNIPTASYIETDKITNAEKFIDKLKNPIVIKADGLCGGKGVIIAQNRDEAKKAAQDMLSGESFGDAGKSIIIEEFLDGYELSVFAVCDGENYKILPAVQDHKRLLDGDKGPNTGGMGAYAPTPLIDDNLYEKIKTNIVEPTLEGMKKEGSPYTGVLFIGLMIVKGKPIVLEYNVRFGDPECEVLMPLLKTPASQLFHKAANGSLKNLSLEFYDKFAVAVVVASKNYPYSASAPAEIIIDKSIYKELNDTHISYAGVMREDDKLYANGGRVLLCIGLGANIKEARNKAYLLCGQVHFVGKQFRHDIAYQALVHD